MSAPPPTFWEQLGPADRAAVEAAARGVTTAAGTSLVREDDPGDVVHVLLDGAVRVTARDGHEHAMLLGLRGPGDLVGELAAIDGRPRTGAVIAIDDVSSLRLSGPDFLLLLDREPGVARAVLRTVAGRLRDADEKRREHVGGDGTARVASRVVELAERFGTPSSDGIVVHLPITQAELASWAGVSLETAARSLATLRGAGWLRTRRGSMTVLDLPALDRRAGRGAPAP